MGALIILGAVVVHFQNCSNILRKKRMEFQGLFNMLGKKLGDLEREVIELQMEIDGIDKQIKSMQ
jgi:SMC interacting uncharacterized protein involved in chromosome segregation